MRISILVTAGLAILASSLWAASAGAESTDDWMLRFTLRDRQVEGMPIAWDQRNVFLLGREGRLWQFAPSEASDYRKTSNRFSSYSTSELRSILLRELGKGFEVTGTGHYMVAHPSGQRDKWAGRFENLYRSFVHYFSVRGFDLSEPPCPLIGVVFRNREEFVKHSVNQGAPSARGVVGYYSPDSNRILLYDTGSDEQDSADWRMNAATAIHEATHQTAFNTGIHSRYTMPPLWIAEGLATMFEAPGVYDSRTYTRQSDRLNPGRLYRFRQLSAAGHSAQTISDLVASDRLFQTRPAEAYAEAWALTFFLVETDPDRYAKYLARTAAREPFKPYTASQRTADFVAVFGDDWRMIEARLLRFIDGLK